MAQFFTLDIDTLVVVYVRLSTMLDWFWLGNRASNCGVSNLKFSGSKAMMVRVGEVG